MIDPATLTLREAAGAIAQGRLHAEALVEACLDRIKRLQPALNRFIRITADSARKQARAADRAVKAGHPLGRSTACRWRTRICSIAPARFAPAGRKSAPISSPTIPQPCSAASTPPEASSSAGSTWQSSPWVRPVITITSAGVAIPAFEHITGGSSSGSGAAVAAGLVFGALGSDTGGSVRLPAAACGVAGIKPTLGRVSRYGAMPLSHSFDCIGVLARSVGDCARLLSVIAGADANDGASSSRRYRTTSAALTRRRRRARSPAW